MDLASHTKSILKPSPTLSLNTASNTTNHTPGSPMTTEAPNSPVHNNAFFDDDEDDDDSKDIWASVLSKVSASKSIPTKNVLIVGDIYSGKSTIAQAFKNINSLNDLRLVDNINELALSYNLAEIKDEGDVIARVGIYQIASDTSYKSLVHHCLRAESLGDSLVVIVVDWSKPWGFMQTLDKWLSAVEQEVVAISKQKNVDLDALQSKLEKFWRSYSEPNVTDSSKPEPAVTTTIHRDLNLPLDNGVLVNNVGIPIVIVASKVDQTIALEKDHDFKDEQFDYIQQALRTMCLKYGAALFYTSSQRPQTMQSLKNYILHRLFSNTTNGDKTTQFGFKEKAQFSDRDCVVIPTGWDSWGKIKQLRSGFECDFFSGNVVGKDENLGFSNAKREYAQIITNQKSTEKARISNPIIAAEDEQSFLENHMDILNSSSSHMPAASGTRAASMEVIDRVSGGAASGATHLSSSISSSRESISGGIGGSSGVINTTTERPSSMLGNTLRSSSSSNSDLLEDMTAKLARLQKKETSAAIPRVGVDRPARFGSNNDIPLPASLNSGSVAAGAPISSNLAGVPGSNQSEQLANFFQSLLNKKSGGGGPQRQSSYNN